MIDLFQIQLGIIRFIEMLFYIIIVIFLIPKNKNNHEITSQNYLKREFCHTFIYWIFYLFFDILSPLVMGLSITEEFVTQLFLTEQNEPVLFTEGNFLSLIIGNILRDIQIAFASFFIYGTYRCLNLIKWGRTIGNFKSKNTFIIIILFIGWLLIVVFDYGGVEVYKDHISIIYNFANYAVFGIFIYLFVILYSCINLIDQLLKGKEGISKEKIPNLRNFTLGYCFICAGMWYWIIIPLIPSKLIPLLFQSIGHLLWILAPLFIGYALIKKKEER
ncbi:MAG: hypothetical protein ACTSRZ_02285 [Promethearchaeota archaeon]